MPFYDGLCFYFPKGRVHEKKIFYQSGRIIYLKRSIQIYFLSTGCIFWKLCLFTMVCAFIFLRRGFMKKKIFFFFSKFKSYLMYRLHMKNDSFCTHSDRVFIKKGKFCLFTMVCAFIFLRGGYMKKNFFFFSSFK